jgi:hypothetical protein
MQELGDHEVRHLIVDRRTEEDDPVRQQAGVDVVRAFAAVGGFDDSRYEHPDLPHVNWWLMCNL